MKLLIHISLCCIILMKQKYSSFLKINKEYMLKCFKLHITSVFTTLIQCEFRSIYEKKQYTNTKKLTIVMFMQIKFLI